MDKPKLLITRRLPEAVQERASRDYQTRVNPKDEPFDPHTLISQAQGCDALLPNLTDRLGADVIGRLPDRVRIIATFSAGIEHIGLDAAQERGIVVTNTPDVLTEATAEIALLLILGAARRAVQGEQMMRSGNWSGWNPTQLLGIQSTGKRLGLVGMGRIGQAVARTARTLGMEIHYHNRKRLSSEEEAGATYHPSIEELLAVSQILSLHCPLTPKTHYLLNASRIALLPKGAVVVNTARGAVIDDNALICALKEGHIAAAGLDVYDKEPAIDSRYLTLDNVFLLPHLGSATVETRNIMGFQALDSLDAFFRGNTPPNRVV